MLNVCKNTQSYKGKKHISAAVQRQVRKRLLRNKMTDNGDQSRTVARHYRWVLLLRQTVVLSNKKM